MYANAYFTPNRGVDSNIQEGDETISYVFANDCRTYIKSHIGESFTYGDIYTIFTPVVDGTLRIGLVAEKPGANWFTIQIKSLRLLKYGIFLYADNKSKIEGDENPELTYTAHSISPNQQTPSLSCNATKDSPAGSYVIKLSTSGISGEYPVYGQSGVMTVFPRKKGKALWCEGNSTMYFLADLNTYNVGDNFKNQTITSVWNETKIIYNGGYPDWLETIPRKVTHVNIDSSFEVVKLLYLQNWFSGCKNLISISGIEHLNTSNVVYTDAMFLGCSSLTSLDLSHFDTSKVENMDFMFSGCSELKTIYCNETWSCNYSDDMFNGCINLVGAIAYNSNKTNVSYANPTTGYFTLKSSINTGDVNGDGDINVFDIVETVDIIMRNKYLKAADCVSDGVIDVFDLVEMVSIVMQQTASGTKHRSQARDQ